MEGIRRESATTQRLAASFGDSRFTLLDIGCSGGIDKGWRTFGDRLTAYGFDPGQAEIARLRAAETDPNVHYINGFVGVPPGHPLRESGSIAWRTNPWRRLSAYRTTQLHQAREAGEPVPPVYELARATPEELKGEAAWLAQVRADQAKAELERPPAAAPAEATTFAERADAADDLMRKNRWGETALADPTRPIYLPDFLAREGLGDLDFLKIDVDGWDFDILRSLSEVIDSHGVLGVTLEVNYIGSDHPDANTFHNIDRFMRSHGFDLFDLSVRRYATDDLPSPFLFDYPYAAQTARGRPIQGDALYIRDFGHPSNGPDPAAWSDDKLLKQAAICALFGLLDQAAETIVTHRARLSGRIDVDAMLDLMTQEIQGLEPDIAGDFPPFASYADYIAAYQADHPAFYGVETRRYNNGRQPAIDLVQTRAEAEALRLEVEGLRRDLRTITRSTSWRLTAPLRLLMGRMLGRR